MQKWRAWMTTPTAVGRSASWIAPATCAVSFSCTCRRLEKMSTTRASFESPTTRPLGM